MSYWHLTCDHGARLILADGSIVRPRPQPYLDNLMLSWWTDDAGLPAAALGLQSEALLTCDRTEARFRSDDPRIVPWTRFRSGLLPKAAVSVSELEFGRSPRHWFVCSEPVKAEMTPWHLKEVT